jgi:hypothetical protein
MFFFIIFKINFFPLKLKQQRSYLFLPDHDPEIVKGVGRRRFSCNELGRVSRQLLYTTRVNVIVLK